VLKWYCGNIIQRRLEISGRFLYCGGDTVGANAKRISGIVTAHYRPYPTAERVRADGCGGTADNIAWGSRGGTGTGDKGD
jgi:hypothetical protein